MPRQSTMPSFGKTIDEATGIVSGIYRIRCLVNGKVYVGSAVNIARRWREHLRQLKANQHHSRYLQRAWDKYGPEAFVFEIIEWVANDRLIEQEQVQIDAAKAASRSCGFNMSPTAGSTLGVFPSEETRQKMSKASRGKPKSDEMRRKLAETNFGRTHSEEAKRKMADAKRGQKLSEEHKRKIGEASRNCVRRPLSDETKRKISDSLRGRVGRPLSDENKRKMNEALNSLVRGPLSDEHKRKISESLLRRARVVEPPTPDGSTA